MSILPWKWMWRRLPRLTARLWAFNGKWTPRWYDVIDVAGEVADGPDVEPLGSGQPGARHMLKSHIFRPMRAVAPLTNYSVRNARRELVVAGRVLWTRRGL